MKNKYEKHFSAFSFDSRDLCSDNEKIPVTANEKKYIWVKYIHL